MDNNRGDLSDNWDADIFLSAEEFDSSELDESLMCYYDSSSPDGSSSKNIVAERNRRNKLNERLFALRAIVPNITKMDKASIIKDAIRYIQELKEQEKTLKSEIEELESGTGMKDDRAFDYDRDLQMLLRLKKRQSEQLYDSGGSGTSPIEAIDLSVTVIGEKTMAVSLTCTRTTETMVKLCEVLETMKLKLITTSIIEVSEKISKTLIIEAGEDEKEAIRLEIETTIAAFNDHRVR